MKKKKPAPTEGKREGKSRPKNSRENAFDKAPVFKRKPLKMAGKPPEKASKPTEKALKAPEKADDGKIRLNRYIANAGICSRRDADELISLGEIRVNGKVVTEMGYRVDPHVDKVTYGKKTLTREKPVYILLNKPKDFLTTTDDPENRRTVMDLVKKVGNERIYPVGRLDRNTTGVLLLTNDGELAKRLTHPSHRVQKIYKVELNKPLAQDHFHQILAGLQLEDGPAKVDHLSVLSPDRKTMGIEIHIGRNRIVRRIFEHFDYDVVRLDRVVFAGLDKKDIPRGQWRILKPEEVIILKHLGKKK
jgi:23S rRNA pseudouridine2605 synthase